jgi:hypothetical protein
MGKNVPARNIIGKVMTCPTTLAVSVLLVTVPTSMPIEEKSIGPRTRNGMSHSVNVMCAPKAKTPTAAISKKESTDKNMYQRTFEDSHSILVIGVKDNCLNNFVFLYSDDMFTRENIGLTSIEKPMRPGIRKSTYL